MIFVGEYSVAVVFSGGGRAGLLGVTLVSQVGGVSNPKMSKEDDLRISVLHSSH